ncbi:hypothetical protein Tco_0212906 [Tanacetum coccineum]
MSSRVSNRTVNIGKPPRNQKPFLKSKDLAFPTCKKCIYSANHDECILKYLSKVHSRASTQKKDAQSHKTTKRYMPVEKKCDFKKHDRQIPIGQKFSLNKSSKVYLNTTPPRSSLTWKPTCRIFTQVLQWLLNPSLQRAHLISWSDDLPCCYSDQGGESAKLVDKVVLEVLGCLL